MKYTLITGATGGLGKAFSELYAKDKNNLILVSTKTDKLQELKAELTSKYGVIVETFTADLSIDSERRAVYEYAKSLGFVNNLVNNAGFGDQSAFKDMDIENQLKMLEVNCGAVLYFTRMFINDMIDNDEGHIINIGSISSFVPGPYLSTYHASKAFVLSLGESVAHEIRKTKVRLLTLCPGPFVSGFVGRAGNIRVFQKMKPITAMSVAEYGYKKSKKGKRVAIVGFSNKVKMFLPRFVTRKFTTRMSCFNIQKNG